VHIQLEIADTVRLLPSSWEEAGALAWPCLRDLARRGPDAGKLRAMRRLTGLGWWQFRQLSPAHIGTLATGLDWLRIQPITFFPRTTYRSIYRLPEPKFSDGTCLQFALADEFFQEYQDGNDQALLHLFCTLARPRRSTALLADRDEVLRRGRFLRRLPAEWVAATWMYWAGVKEYVYHTYGPWLFQAPAEDDEPDNPRGPDTGDTGPNFGWWGRFMDVAESGVFGSLEEVHRTNFHTLCVFLVKKEAEHRRQQQEIQRIRQQQSRA
jgi:hypothetical protein